MENEELAKHYLSYSQWFVAVGSKLHEEETKKVRKLMSEYKKEGKVGNETFFKASKKVGMKHHPEEDFAWKAEKIIEEGGDCAWDLLKKIINGAPEDKILLGYIGAGPFENWVTFDNYLKYEKELKEIIKNSEKWRVVVSGSWHNPEDLELYLSENDFRRDS